jgi:predicted component of type VI protein secretion system
LEEVEMLEEVLGEVKDLFISHRVDPYFRHLDMMKRLAKKALKNEKKEIPIHELVRQDMVFILNKRKIEVENAAKETAKAPASAPA